MVHFNRVYDRQLGYSQTRKDVRYIYSFNHSILYSQVQSHIDIIKDCAGKMTEYINSQDPNTVWDIKDVCDCKYACTYCYTCTIKIGLEFIRR